MPKKSITPVSPASRWLNKRAAAGRQNQEDEKDELFNKRQQIAARIKQAGIKLKMIVKTKFADDLRAFEYVVQKIDRLSGEVFLKNERGTVRKISVFDKLFGPDAKTRTR